jgi:hypothetical protein
MNYTSIGYHIINLDQVQSVTFVPAYTELEDDASDAYSSLGEKQSPRKDVLLISFGGSKVEIHGGDALDGLKFFQNLAMTKRASH